MGRKLRSTLVAAATAAAALASVAPADASAGGLHWASAATAKIKPGLSSVDVAGVRCVVGFLLTDGTRVYAAVPASCTGVSDGQPTNGCTEAQVPYGLKVPITGARFKAVFVYSSFVRMQLAGTRRTNVCHNNDLSLLRLDPRDIKRANPSLAAVGGPTGVSQSAPAFPDQLTVVLSGASTRAAADATASGGWSHTMVVGGPVNDALVGSPVVDGQGKALGMVSFTPQQGGPGTSTATDLYREITFLQKVRGFRHVHLAKGTMRYTPTGV